MTKEYDSNDSIHDFGAGPSSDSGNHLFEPATQGNGGVAYSIGAGLDFSSKDGGYYYDYVAPNAYPKPLVVK